MIYHVNILLMLPLTLLSKLHEGKNYVDYPHYYIPRT